MRNFEIENGTEISRGNDGSFRAPKGDARELDRYGYHECWSEKARLQISVSWAGVGSGGENFEGHWACDCDAQEKGCCESSKHFDHD